MAKIYISLGYNCDPRIYIKHELGLSKENGYNSCPFDLCITPFESLYKCIETDFKYFFDDLKLISWACPVDRPKDDIENKHAITNHYNMIFNHESSGFSHTFNIGKNDDLFYFRNNFEKFKERYSVRINNFRDYIRNYDKIIFIYKKYNNYDGKFLINLLREKYNKNIEIIEI
jgi:hypothetical protein